MKTNWIDVDEEKPSDGRTVILRVQLGGVFSTPYHYLARWVTDGWLCLSDDKFHWTAVGKPQRRAHWIDIPEFKEPPK